MKEEAGQFIRYEHWLELHEEGKELFFYVIRRNDKDPKYRWDVFKSAAGKISDVDKWSLFDEAAPFEGNLPEAKKKVIRGLI